jgi:hypothetical protein
MLFALHYLAPLFFAAGAFLIIAQKQGIGLF